MEHPQMDCSDSDEVSPMLIVSFRGRKHEFELREHLVTALHVKSALIDTHNVASLQATDIKLIFKGKALEDNDNLKTILKPAGKRVYKLLGVGRSREEVCDSQQALNSAQKQAPRVRDDLSDQGKREVERRKRLGRRVLKQQATKEGDSYVGFGRIETLNLPDQEQAKRILNQLANDPGVLACMKLHNWHVGALKEMYPKGNVGKSPVCIMGLNRNKGQEILLRLRTDDLRGFRKMLSIRKVLFHELAHNVHSDHDAKFFQLMRQIEQECNAMDWTQGEGLSSHLKDEYSFDSEYDVASFVGGTRRLGGNSNNGLTARELRATAALIRMTREEEEIERSCGCEESSNFLPDSLLQCENDDKEKRREDRGSMGN